MGGQGQQILTEEEITAEMLHLDEGNNRDDSDDDRPLPLRPKHQQQG